MTSFLILMLKREMVISSASNLLVVTALRHLSKVINFRRNYPTLNFSEQLSAQVPARNRSVLCSDDGWVQVAADSSAVLQFTRKSPAVSVLRCLHLMSVPR